MAGSADTYCVLSQPSPLMYGQAGVLMLAITNTSSSTAYTVTSVSVWATNTRGSTSVSASIQQPQIPVSGVSAVAASGTLYVPVGVKFFGQPVVGIPSAANENFLVTAQVLYSDGSSISCSPLAVNLVDPIWGASPGSPPNAATTVSALQFSNPANSGLHLLGWV